MHPILVHRILGIRRAIAAMAVVSGVVGLALPATAQTEGDQSWGSSEPSQPAPSSTSSQTQGQAFDESAIRGNKDYTGPYLQFGVSVGEIDEADTGGGFTMTGGYRVLPWLSAEGNFTYLGGGDADGTSREASYFGFSFGPKIYPLGLFEDQPIPEIFQPYGLIAIGGGEYDIDDGDEESTFVARFIFGFDLWMTDNIGAFMEGGYHVFDGDELNGNDIDGMGIFTVGAQYRF
jgi:hypothetical protein